SMMDQHHISCVLICRENKPLGIVTDRDLTHLIGRNAIHASTTVAEVMAHPVISIHDSSNYFDVMEYFREHRIRHLVLLNQDEEVSGIVTETDIINTLETIELLASIPVSDVMSDKVVVSVMPASTLRKAIDQMNHLNIGSIVVADQCKPVGILTESDIPHLLDQGIDLDSRIDAVIPSRVPAIPNTLTSFDALQVLREERCHHLIVLHDNGEVAGVLSRSDFTKGLIKKHLNNMESMIEQQQRDLYTARLELADMRKQEAEDKYHTLLQAATDAVISINDQGIIIEFNPAAEKIFGYAKADAIGKELADLIMPPSIQEKHRSGLKRYLVSGESANMGKLIEVSAIRSDGTEVPLELTITPIYAKQGTRFTAFLRDITLRKQSEQKLDRRTQQLSHLARASLRINAKLEIAQIMSALVDEAMLMVNAQSGAAGLFIEGCMQFHEYMTGGQCSLIDMSFEPGCGVPGWVIQNKRPYLSDDAEHDPHVIPEIQQQLGFHKLVDVPILSRQGELLGCFEMHDREDGCAFDSEDVEILQSLAATAAVALENAGMLKEVNRLNLAIEQVNDIVFYLDRDGCVQHINLAGEHITGLPHAQIIGQSFWRFCAPESLPVVRAMFEKKIRGEVDTTHYECIALSASGKRFAIEINSQSILDEHGHIAGVFAIARDITKRKQAEAQAERLRTMLESTSDFVGMTDANGHVVYVNPAGKHMVGLDINTDVTNMMVADFHSLEESQRIFNEVLPKAASDGACQCECSFLHADGHEMITSAVFMAQKLAEEKHPSFYSVIARDLTAERDMQARVEHSQRLESLGVLAGGIAHDFNNILTAILGNAAMAERKSLINPQDTQRYLGNIVASSEKAAELCKQMLAYSGKGKFVVKAVDLSTMVEEITKLLEISIAKGVVLKYHLAEGLPAVEVDVAQLQQVIRNLVINASDAIGEKSGVISIATGVMQADSAYLAGTSLDDALPAGRYVYLEVSDTGCGMDKQTQAKLFEPFFTTKFTGHGLGMSAVLG
ncbi:MAG: PAS domain S-box protein, partial [Mariprofundaceae bacterium]|nr:PAS domain S-box protein [Mariprofundaceae bacterium]